MSKPPPTPPSSDIEGVNRDARVGTASKDAHPEPGGALRDADTGSTGQPNEGGPSKPAGGGD